MVKTRYDIALKPTLAITPCTLGHFGRAWSQNDRNELSDAARHVSDERYDAYFGRYGPKRVFVHLKELV